MSKERFEVFGNIIKDNEDIPALLNNYQATVRLNELNDKVKELEKELAELKQKSIIPRFKVNDRLFVIVNNEIEEYYVDEVLLRNKGTLVAYRDICKKTEITEKNELFSTEEEAQEKLKEMKGNG